MTARDFPTIPASILDAQYVYEWVGEHAVAYKQRQNWDLVLPSEAPSLLAVGDRLEHRGAVLMKRFQPARPSESEITITIRIVP